MLFFLDNLQISQLSVSLQCVFHSIRFKVNKGWSTAVLLFLCPYLSKMNDSTLYSLRALTIISYTEKRKFQIITNFTKK